MSELKLENAESTNENPSTSKYKNQYKFGDRKGPRRYSYKENTNDANKSTVSFEEIKEEGNESDQRRPYGKPFVDRVEDKIVQLSYKPTTELPPVDMSEKKFSGKNRIYIANVSMETTEDDLESLFKPYGETTEIFINKDRHFAFVKMDYHRNAEKAQRELDGVTLKNKNLKLKISPSCSAVKVKNLTPYVTNELLHYAFSVFGEVERAVVLVDEKGKSIGEGIIDFTRKNSATLAIQKCREKCYFLTYSLKPVVVEHYDLVDQSVGLSDRHFNARNFEFNQDRSAGPHLAEMRSFDHEYGNRWKSIYDLYRQKEEALRVEFRLDCEKLEAQMEFARFEHETENLREQLRVRELNKERQKREWEAKERMAKEERIRAEAQIRQAEEEMHAKLRQSEDMRRRHEEEATLLMQAQNLTSILDNQEILDYDAPTSSTRDMSLGHYNERDTFANTQSNVMGYTRGSSEGFEHTWNRPSNVEGHWVREDIRDRSSHVAKKRRF